MSSNGIANSKIGEVAKLRTKPFIYPYHPLPSVNDPIDYTSMMKTNIFGFTVGYVGQKSFYPASGSLLQDPGYHLIRSSSEYLRDGDGKNYHSSSL